MSLSDDLAPVKNFIGRVEAIDENGLVLAERIIANPEAAAAAQVIASLAGLNLPAGYITGLFSTAEKMLNVFTGSPAAAAQ
jgi:hypothetical protein